MAWYPRKLAPLKPTTAEQREYDKYLEVIISPTESDIEFQLEAANYGQPEIQPKKKLPPEDVQPEMPPKKKLPPQDVQPEIPPKKKLPPEGVQPEKPDKPEKPHRKKRSSVISFTPHEEILPPQKLPPVKVDAPLKTRRSLFHLAPKKKVKTQPILLEPIQLTDTDDHYSTEYTEDEAQLDKQHEQNVELTTTDDYSPEYTEDKAELDKQHEQNVEVNKTSKPEMTPAVTNYDHRVSIPSTRLSDVETAPTEDIQVPEVTVIEQVSSVHVAKSISVATELEPETPASISSKVSSEVLSRSYEIEGSFISNKSADSVAKMTRRFKEFPEEADLAQSILEAMFKRDRIKDTRLSYTDTSDGDSLRRKGRKKEKESLWKKVPKVLSKRHTDMETCRKEEDLDKIVSSVMVTELKDESLVDRTKPRKFVKKIKLPSYLTAATSDIPEPPHKKKLDSTGEIVGEEKAVSTKQIREHLTESKRDKEGKLRKRVLDSTKSESDKQQVGRTEHDDLLRLKTGKEKLTEDLTAEVSEETVASSTEYVPRSKPPTKEELWVQQALMRRAITKVSSRKQTPEPSAVVTPEVKEKVGKRALTKTRPEHLTAEKGVLQKDIGKEAIQKKPQEMKPDARPKPGRLDFEKALTLTNLKAEETQDDRLEDILMDSSRKKAKELQVKTVTGGSDMTQQESSSSTTEDMTESSTTSTSETSDEFSRETSLKHSIKQSKVARPGDKKVQLMKEQFFKRRHQAYETHKKASERVARHVSIELPAHGMLKEVNKEDLHQKLAVWRKSVSKQQLRSHDRGDSMCAHKDPKTLVMNYLKAKQIYELFQFLMNRLLLDAPARPLEYLIELVRFIDEKQSLVVEW